VGEADTARRDRASSIVVDVGLVAFSHAADVKVAEVGFLLFVIAGVWIASASLTKVERTHLRLRFVVVASSRFRIAVAGALLACGGVLLIVATRWGHLFPSETVEHS
jgi:hypothetical protein